MLSGASYRSFRGFAVTFTPILPYALALQRVRWFCSGRELFLKLRNRIKIRNCHFGFYRWIYCNDG
jgi:hypothetical protein